MKSPQHHTSVPAPRERWGSDRAGVLPMPLTASLGMAGCLTFFAPLPGQAVSLAEPVALEQSLLGDFRQLAQMRPRLCAAGGLSAAPAPGWQEASAQCAWQGRLMVTSWSAPPASPSNCVSPGAFWWRWERERYGAVQFPSAVWFGAWSSQAVAFDSGDTKHLMTVVRGVNGTWIAREWRWKPSDRPATRRWQLGRWKLLLDASQLLRQSVPSAAKEQPLQSLMSAWVRTIDSAPGEVVADQWRWGLDGRCMIMDAMGLSQGGFQMPHLVEDSRLEQRSAMQLQLARRHPGVVWLRPFSLVDVSSQGKAGLARFKAVWREQDMIRGQLWIPTKGHGPVLQLRVSTQVPGPAVASGASVPPAAQAVEQVLERLVRFVGNIDG